MTPAETYTPLPNNDPRAGCIGLLTAAAIMLIVLLFGLLLSACSTKRTITEKELTIKTDTLIRQTVKTDTVRIFQTRTDTIREKDSVIIHTYTRGDTVYQDRLAVRYIYKSANADRRQTQKQTESTAQTEKQTDIRQTAKQETKEKPSTARNRSFALIFALIAATAIGYWIKKK